jgi:RimJ/RimL family protein N-acetyltransferase
MWDTIMNMMIIGPLEIKPVTLVGKVVRLEPLDERHTTDLGIAGSDPGIWEYMVYSNLSEKGAMLAWVRMLLDLQKQGTDLPFAVIHQESNRAIGATRYMEIHPEHRNLEIGGTWYGVAFQRTAVNTECKYLLLRHAFEDLGCVRVQFKTDARNLRSQHALERIGAVKEGVLRQQMITATGYLRDSVYYSILDSEWPEIKKRLEAMLTSNR